MTFRRLCQFFLVITELALATTVGAEEIYRCGNSYSQTPCADAKVLQIDDVSDASLKKEADAATRRDAQLAKELEHERLQAEQASAPKQSKQKIAKKPLTAASQVTQDPGVTLKPERHKTAQKPKDFTALVPGSGQKSGHSKQAVKAKTAASK